MRYLFVCTGNTCRSPMAAYLFNHFAAETPHRAESAGLAAWDGDPITEHARAVLQELYGIDAGDHRARLFHPDLAESADLILTMNRQQRDTLRRILPERADSILTMGEAAGLPDEEIVDPFGRDRTVYERTARQLERLVRRILESLASGSSSLSPPDEG